MSKRPELRPIYSLIARVQRRERAAEALALTVRIALPTGLIIAAGSVVAARLLMTPIDYAWAALAPIPVVLAWVAVRRRSLRATARRVDAHYKLDDRIGNALEFSEQSEKIPNDDPRTRDMAELAIVEGAKAVSGLAAKPVVKFVVPKPRVLDGLSLALLLAALLLPQRVPAVPEDQRLSGDEIPELETDEAKRGLDMTRAEPLREELRKLENSKEEQVARISAELLGVLEDLETGEIDRAEALRRLDELEEQLHEAETAMEEQLEEDPWMMSEAMRELAEDLREHEIMEEIAEALAKSDAEEVEKELQELMDKAEAEGNEQLKKQLDEALQEMEKSLQQSSNEQTGTEKAMEEAERDLERQKKNPAEDPEEQERALERKKEKLEELKRQHEREQKAREQLDELQKLSRDSQGNSQQGSSKEKRQDAQKKLSQGAGKASQKSRQSKQMNDVRDAMDQAKSFVQREGQNGESNNRRKQQQQRFAKAAKGQKGKDGKPATMLVEGEVGEDGEPMGSMGEGQEGEGQGEGEGESDSDGDSDGDAQGQGQGNQPGAGVGPGIGEGSVEALGDPSSMDVNAKNERVDADHGKGQTRAEVIETASQEGFATESYKRVYQDYESFAQSAMDSEELPEGQKRRVKRYYQMIQPRD